MSRPFYLIRLRAQKSQHKRFFGPVVCIYGYQTIDDAIRAKPIAWMCRSNQLLFSDNVSLAMDVAKKLEASASDVLIDYYHL